MVREIEKSDLEGILELYLDLHEKKIPEDNNHLQSIWEEIISNQNYHIIVNEIEGKIVASCTCIIVPNLTHNVRKYALIENVVTHHEYRNKGYATECLNFAKALAEKEDCYKMMLMTGSKEESTLKFYQNAGYSSGGKTGFVQWLNEDPL